MEFRKFIKRYVFLFVSCFFICGCQSAQMGISKKTGETGKSNNSAEMPEVSQTFSEDSKEETTEISEERTIYLRHYIEVLSELAKAAYVPDVNYSGTNVVKDNIISGYSLFIDEDTLISPVKDSRGEKAFLVSAKSLRPKIYNFPENPDSENSFYNIYNLKIQSAEKLFPISIAVPKVYLIKINLQPDLVYRAYWKELDYKIYLRTIDAATGHRFVEGVYLEESDSKDVLFKEIVQRIMDILEACKMNNLYFLDGLNNPPKLKSIEQAFILCVQLPEPEIHEAIGKVLEELHYK